MILNVTDPQYVHIMMCWIIYSLGAIADVDLAIRSRSIKDDIMVVSFIDIVRCTISVISEDTNA